VKQQLLFESDYIALARRGHPGVKQSAMSKAVFLRRDSAASTQASEAGYQTVLARAIRCGASTDVVAKDAQSGGRKCEPVTGTPQQLTC
jgi:hypothetical protein